MIVEITGRYTGNLGTMMVHGPSGATLRTAAPADNQGDGSTFSPTDLAAAPEATEAPLITEGKEASRNR